MQDLEPLQMAFWLLDEAKLKWLDELTETVTNNSINSYNTMASKAGTKRPNKKVDNTPPSKKAAM
eukprot:6024432-Lingulodinium_polyedra.AAC.1